MLGRLKNLLSTAPSNELLSKPPEELAELLAADPELIDKVGKSATRQTIGSLIYQTDRIVSDAQLWLRFIPYAIKHGLYASPREPIPAEQAYSALRPLLFKLTDGSAAELAQLILHPGLDTTEVQKITDYCTSLAEKLQPHQRSMNFHSLCYAIKDKFVLRKLIDHENREVRDPAIRGYVNLLIQDASNELYDFARERPQAILQLKPRQDDPELWRILMESDDADCKQWALSRVLEYFSWRRKESPHDVKVIELLHKGLSTDSEFVLSHFQRRVQSYGGLFAASAKLLWQQHIPQIDPLILGLMARESRALEDPEQALVADVTRALPDSLANVPSENLGSLVQNFDTDLLTQTSTHILAVVAKSANKSLREACSDAFGRCDANLLVELGWLDTTTKNVRQTCQQILMAHPDPAAHKHLRKLFSAKGGDQIMRDHILDHLESANVDVSDLDAMGSDPIGYAEAEAGKKHRAAKIVDDVYSPQLAKTLSALSPQTVHWLLRQMTNKDSQLSRSARKVLIACSRNQCIQFAQALLSIWVSKDGDPKLAWVLKSLETGADDSQVGLLRDTINAWHKKRKLRAVRAIEALGQIGTTFALSQVKVIAETRRNSDSLIQAARNTLREAAQHKGISISELYDGLVPDFGLCKKEGLALDVGPHAYHVKLLGDLSLRVVAPNGKETKTFPKAKPDEDVALHAAATTRFKQLRKDLKQLAEQQIKRLPALLMGVRQWPAPTWRKLYIDHPIFRTLAQSLIWTRRDTSGVVLGSFRVSEDLSLIDSSDNETEVSDSELVALWHPIDQSNEVATSWRQHFEDYAIKPIVEQIELVAHVWQDDWLKNVPARTADGAEIEIQVFSPYQGYAMNMSQLKLLMNRLNYRVGPTEDGGNIYEHTLALEDAGLNVCLSHTRMPAYYEENHELAIREFDVFSSTDESRAHYQMEHGRVKPQSLPAATLSILYSHAKELADAGSGYDDNWEKL